MSQLSEKVIKILMSSNNLIPDVISETMDSVLNISHFSILKATLKDINLRKSIRLVTVFGVFGSEVIFATHEDRVYGFGLNKRLSRFGVIRTTRPTATTQ